MHIGSTPPVDPAARGSALIRVMKAANETQTALAEKLIAVTVQNAISMQKMQTAGQIIDTYA